MPITIAGGTKHVCDVKQSHCCIWAKLVLLSFCLLTLFLAACSVSQTVPIRPVPSTRLSPLPAMFPKIDRHPATAITKRRGQLSRVPIYDPSSSDPGQVDLRGWDLSALDVRDSLNNLLFADFDTLTKWPAANKLPKGFDWRRTMELGKNPGLGVRQLHAKGITGRGVGIGIIDKPLLVDHQEYVNQLRFYEEANDIEGESRGADMHGAAVASIAAGKTVGVALEADLYYIATMCLGTDFACVAKSVRRILEVNQQLPAERKIRVLSMAIGWNAESPGYDEIMAATVEAKAAGLLVISSSVEKVHGFKFHALGRSPMADPNSFDSYEPGLFWAKDFYKGQRFSDRLLVPMDSRTTASPTGVDEYVFYREGGWSWSIPYIAGMYALAAQVQPGITPDHFWSLAMETGRVIQLQHDGQTVPFGPILDPMALIIALQAE